MKTDIPSSALRDAFQASMKSVGFGRRLGGTVYQLWDLELFYEVSDVDASANASDPGVLRGDILANIASFETGIRQLPGWVELCKGVDEQYQGFCMQGISMANYAMSSRNVSDGEIVPQELTLDAQGTDAIPVEVAMDMIRRHQIQDFLFPTGFSVHSSSSKRLRSCFRFIYPAAASEVSVSERRIAIADNLEKWRAFASKQLLPYLRKHASVGAARMYYTGRSLESLDLEEMMSEDMLLAIISVSLVLSYMVYYTQGVFLGLMGLILVVTAVPLAYVLIALLTGDPTISLAFGLSLFLVVGIGSDVVFVYSDFWKASRKRVMTDKQRMIWTYRHAGKASLATTATTAASFLANLASVLKSLRQFGFFMGMCVILVWALVSLLFLPVCAIEERIGARWRSRCRPRESRWPRCSWWPALKEVLRERLRCSCLSSMLPTFRVDYWVRSLAAYKYITVALWLALAAGAMVSGIALANTNTSLPSIYPEEHNHNKILSLSPEFRPLNSLLDLSVLPKPILASVCDEKELDPFRLAHCSLFWCEVKTQAPAVNLDRCSCARQQRNCTNQAQISALVVQRFVHKANTDFSSLDGSLGEFLGNNSEGLFFDQARTRKQHIQAVKHRPPLVLHDWYTGSLQVAALTEVSTNMRRSLGSSLSPSSCGWTDLCFCGLAPCSTPRAPWLALPTGPDLPGARRLAVLAGGFSVPLRQRAFVDVSFGLSLSSDSSILGKVEDDKTWAFDADHEAQNPWTQRNLLKFCEELPEDLRITDKICWIEDFKSFALTRTGRFPVLPTSFDKEATYFAETTVVDETNIKDYIWIRSGEVKASRMRFRIDVHRRAPVFESLRHKSRWDAYVDSYNANAPRSARDAVQTADLWVQAEAVRELISSTVITVVIAIAFSFFGTLLVTFDLLLSIFVVMATISVICFLMFFMVVVMGWVIGPIEIIALIAFIGYAMTYSLHIVHRYGSFRPLSIQSTDRKTLRMERVSFSVRSIGMAALGSANTTVGCSLPMVLCTLTIFNKLGGVILVVTVLSILMALVPLPSLLLCAGPMTPGWWLPALKDWWQKQQTRMAKPEQAEPEPELPESGTMDLEQAERADEEDPKKLKPVRA
eukprot:TRINITY_DN103707_c0_g1_i1.p1 TRINITY_DN103707_c0_g1~~TRINITY_DN103707_c0_g1_i1.p1  ORF type:complete len:1167 (-),score=146.91 TRINITY_DN103707_c0_g1_i1:295-3615(-)